MRVAAIEEKGPTARLAINQKSPRKVLSVWLTYRACLGIPTHIADTICCWLKYPSPGL